MQIQLRFCLLETTCEQKDEFPPSICVRVNNKIAPLPVRVVSQSPLPVRVVCRCRYVSSAGTCRLPVRVVCRYVSFAAAVSQSPLPINIVCCETSAEGEGKM